MHYYAHWDSSETIFYIATEKEIISRKTETFYSKTKAKTYKQIKLDNICRKVYKI